MIAEIEYAAREGSRHSAHAKTAFMLIVELAGGCEIFVPRSMILFAAETRGLVPIEEFDAALRWLDGICLVSRQGAGDRG